jgi:hypothetical protein
MADATEAHTWTMVTKQGPRPTVYRTALLLIVLSFVVSACSALPFDVLPLSGNQTEQSTPSPEPTPKDICSALFDLDVAVDEVIDTDLVAVGVNGLLDEVNAAVEELDALADAVGQVYRPLVDDLDDSLTGVRDTLNELGDQPSLGASVASVGVAITEIGLAMEALSVQLQTPCEGTVRFVPETSE